ncbi:MAG: epimerase [Azospira oryzae]|jgi:hypothetical protein|nr:MAG: epimerase [Azospira oryzae]
MKINALITGTTGMVGEGVLHECLLHPQVESVVVINRRPSGVTHPKLKEILHTDFFDFTPIRSQLVGYNACYFCMGVSSVGMKEPEYTRLTYDITVRFARLLAPLNPDMTFCYVSGAGTDSTETKGMWARVKGKTENELKKLPFKKVYLFRPGYMHPTPGLKNTITFYKYIAWMYPFLRWAFPGSVSTLKELGLAMINCSRKEYGQHLLEVKDIVRMAKD